MVVQRAVILAVLLVGQKVAKMDVMKADLLVGQKVVQRAAM